jgi:hypothetical protein
MQSSNHSRPPPMHPVSASHRGRSRRSSTRQEHSSSQVTPAGSSGAGPSSNAAVGSGAANLTTDLSKTCIPCNITFANNKQKKDHDRNVHIKPGSYQCTKPGCNNLKFDHNGSLNYHKKLHHTTDEEKAALKRKNYCAVCKCGFLTSTELNRHNKTNKHINKNLTQSAGSASHAPRQISQRPPPAPARSAPAASSAPPAPSVTIGPPYPAANHQRVRPHSDTSASKRSKKDISIPNLLNNPNNDSGNNGSAHRHGSNNGGGSSSH